MTENCSRGQMSDVGGRFLMVLCHLSSTVQTADVGVEPGPGAEDAGQERESQNKYRPARTEDWIGERGAFSYSEHRTLNIEL